MLVKTLTTPKQETINILLVEDNLINQKVACQFLVKWGMKVTVANHGKEALDLLGQHRYHLILMDLQMPEMDGCEATRYIRAKRENYFQMVPIIAFTASTMADSKEKAELLGMNDFLSKPLNPEEMHNKITHYIMNSISDDDRPLQLNLEAYADDADFKLSLIMLITNNIRELQQAGYKAFYAKEVQEFKTISHKVKSSLILLNDEEFTTLTEQMAHDFASAGSTSIENMTLFNKISERIIKALLKETEVLKAAQ